MASNSIGSGAPMFGPWRTPRPVKVEDGNRAVGYDRSRLMQDVWPARTASKPQAAAGRAPVQPPPRTTRSKVLHRTIVKRPTYKRKRGLQLTAKTALFALATILFLFGVGVGIDGLRSNRQVIAQVQGLQQKAAATESDDSDAADDAPTDVAMDPVPDETNRPNVNGYRVAADLPRVLYIPGIGVEARVLHLGTTSDGAIATPASIFDTGWYRESAKPGQPGAMLIDGHVHGPIEPGVFADLKKLKPGDEVKIERGDGQIFTYQVVDSKTYPAESVDMGAALRSAQSGRPGLNLITCTGKLDRATNSYKERLVVFTVQK